MPVRDACRRNKRNRPNYTILNYVFVIPCVFFKVTVSGFQKLKCDLKPAAACFIFPLAAKEERLI